MTSIQIGAKHNGDKSENKNCHRKNRAACHKEKRARNIKGCLIFGIRRQIKALAWRQVSENQHWIYFFSVNCVNNNNSMAYSLFVMEGVEGFEGTKKGVWGFKKGGCG